MVVIINELSFAGQFSDVRNFLTSLKPFISVLRALNETSCNVLKNQSFYSSNITREYTIFDLFKDRVVRSSDELRGLANELAKLSSNPPYWDQEGIQRHTQRDKYICTYTSLENGYGLAEAVEYDLLVTSISHDSFLSDSLQIKKNSNEYKILNFSSLEFFLSWFSSMLENNELVLNKQGERFPAISISNDLLAIRTFYSRVRSKDPNEQIALCRYTGNLVAIINGWKISPHITSKNDRNIYTKKLKNNDYYLSIDTETIAFELFNHAGEHLGEYDFKSEMTERPKSHRINVK